MNMRNAGLMLVLSSSTIAYAIDDGAFERCRGIRDASARLACYDGLPMGGSPPARDVPPIAPSRAPAPAPQPAQTFGMEQQAPAVELPTTMESYIPGRFEGWGPNARIKLANATVWQVVDGTSAYLSLDNPRVIIRRGMMGGFFLELENTNRSPRVRRLQ